jgi:hypothetical protein
MQPNIAIAAQPRLPLREPISRRPGFVTVLFRFCSGFVHNKSGELQGHFLQIIASGFVMFLLWCYLPCRG